MPVNYLGPSGIQTIVPAPFVSVQKNYTFDENGQVLYPEYTFTLTGTLVGHKNDIEESGPDSPLSFDMGNIVTQQQQLRFLFSKQNSLLQITSPNDVNKKIEAYTRVQSINIEDSTWVQTARYTVVLIANNLVNDDDEATTLKSKSENWSIQEQNTGIFAITHTLQAVGLELPEHSGSNQALLAAKDYCYSNSYVIQNSGSLVPVSGDWDMSLFLSNLSSPSGNYWNYSMGESIGRTSNSWQITETFIHYSGGSTREQWSATTNEDINDLGRATVSVDGTIFGYASVDSDFQTKIDTANSEWASVQNLLFNRADTYKPTGFNINPVPSTKRVSYNRNDGQIAYTYSYDAFLGTVISGALQESIDVNDTGKNDVFAEIQVPGRAIGPVVQYMNTKTLPQRSVSIDLLMQAPSGEISASSLLSLYLEKPNVDTILEALKPASAYYYITNNTEAWNPIKRKYTRNITWTIHNDAGPVSGIPVGINQVP